LEGIKDKNLPVIKSILGVKADSDIRDENGDTPIFSSVKGSYKLSQGPYSLQDHERCCKFDSKLAKTLLGVGANTNLKSKQGYPPLIASIVDPYIERFANYYNEELHLNYLEKNLKLIKNLLRYQADPNLRAGEYDWTSLFFASTSTYHNHFVHNANFNPEFALQYLDRRGTIVQVLLDANANVNIRDGNNGIPLHQAVYLGYCPIISKLLEHRADTTVRDQEGLQPMHMSITNNRNGEIVLRLLQHRADLSATTFEGDTVLSLTENQNAVTMIQDVKESGVITNSFLLACLSADDGLVNELIDANADVDQTDKKGRTGLILAATATEIFSDPTLQKSAEGIVKRLLAVKADPGIEANDGTTALAKVGNVQVEKMIKNFFLAESQKPFFESLKKMELSGEIIELPDEVVELILKIAGVCQLIP